MNTYNIYFTLTTEPNTWTGISLSQFSNYNTNKSQNRYYIFGLHTCKIGLQTDKDFTDIAIFVVMSQP